MRKSIWNCTQSHYIKYMTKDELLCFLRSSNIQKYSFGFFLCLLFLYIWNMGKRFVSKLNIKKKSHGLGLKLIKNPYETHMYNLFRPERTFYIKVIKKTLCKNRAAFPIKIHLIIWILREQKKKLSKSSIKKYIHRSAFIYLHIQMYV